MQVHSAAVAALVWRGGWPWQLQVKSQLMSRTELSKDNLVLEMPHHAPSCPLDQVLSSRRMTPILRVMVFSCYKVARNSNRADPSIEKPETSAAELRMAEMIPDGSFLTERVDI